MKITKLIRLALFAVVMVTLTITSCQKAEIYSIDSPSDLESKIDSIEKVAIRQQEIADSIEAARLAAEEARYTEDIYQVGVTDNSTGWWSAFSKYYRLETNADTVTIRFKNFTSGKNVWNNWLAAITSDDVRQGDNGYVEYCIWRADNYSNFAWGNQNGTFWNTADGVDQALQQKTNYDDMATENENFEAYATLMHGADCRAEVTRGGDTVYVDVTMTPISGSVLKKSFYIVESGIEDQPVRFWLFSEGGHLVVYKTIGEPLADYTPDFELDPNWNSGAIVEEEEPDIVTYRADVTATITATSGSVFTYTFFATELPYGGYGSFLLTDGGHMDMDPVGTYYSALADVDNAGAWYYPYSAVTTVGNVTNDTPWWSAFTEYTSVVGEANFQYKFVNYTGTAGFNWNNWLLVLTNGHKRESKSYKECFVLRSDNFGWGEFYSGDNLTNDYDWDNFNANMNGATVEISVSVSIEESAAKSATLNKALKPGETIK